MKSFTRKFAVALFLLLLPALSQALEFQFEKDQALPMVYVTVAFKGGASQDPDGKSGVTDLMGSLLLRGTKTKTKQQIDLALDQMGATLEFETRSEYVTLRGAVLSRNLGSFLSLLDEILTTPSFREQELEKLKKEQISSLLDSLGRDQSVVRLRFDETFFKGHPYSKPNDGKIKDIQSITAADLKTQYQHLINANEMFLLGTGDAKEKDFDGFIADIKAKRNQVVPVPVLPAFTTGPKKLKVVIFDKPDRTQTQVMIGQTGVQIDDPKLDALELANYAFGGSSFQARLMVELRVKRGWTYGAYSSYKLGSRPNSWKVMFYPKNADTPPAIKEAIRLIREFQQKGISEAEFQAARQSLMASSAFTFNTPQKRLENKMIEMIFNLPEDYFKNSAKRLSTLTLQQVNQAVASTITPDHLMVGILATASISKADIAKALGIPEKDIEVQNYQKE